VNAKDEGDGTPLHTAALIGTAELIEFLLSAGANAKAKDKEGETPFDVAKKSDAFKGTDAYWKLNDAQYN
tara:strand:- start:52 stop:261 length:210 start_codon:yes stop_codon:yes gene_type:complete